MIYVGLLLDTVTFREPSPVWNYSRIAVGRGPEYWITDRGAAVNVRAVVFPVASSPWGTIRAAGLFTVSAGGPKPAVVIGLGDRHVSAHTTFRIAPAALRILSVDMRDYLTRFTQNEMIYAAMIRLGLTTLRLTAEDVAAIADHVCQSDAHGSFKVAPKPNVKQGTMV